MFKLFYSYENLHPVTLNILKETIEAFRNSFCTKNIIIKALLGRFPLTVTITIPSINTVLFLSRIFDPKLTFFIQGMEFRIQCQTLPPP